MSLVLEKYKKGWLLKGDTKPIKDVLKQEYRGSWNGVLGGWVFSDKSIDKLKIFIDSKNMESKKVETKDIKTELKENKVEKEKQELKVETKTKVENEVVSRNQVKKEYRQMFDEVMKTSPSREDAKFQPIRLISYSSFVTKAEKEYIYGACSWCKANSDDCCVVLLHTDGKIFPRPVCPDCGYMLTTDKVLDDKDFSAFPRTHDWYKRTPFLVKNDSLLCGFCKKCPGTCKVIGETTQSNMCKDCACCWMFFY